MSIFNVGQVVYALNKDNVIIEGAINKIEEVRDGDGRFMGELHYITPTNKSFKELVVEEESDVYRTFEGAKFDRNIKFSIGDKVFFRYDGKIVKGFISDSYSGGRFGTWWVTSSKYRTPFILKGYMLFKTRHEAVLEEKVHISDICPKCGTKLSLQFDQVNAENFYRCENCKYDVNFY